MIEPSRKNNNGTLETLDYYGKPLMSGRTYNYDGVEVIITGEEILDQGPHEPKTIIYHNLGILVFEADYVRKGIKKLPIYNSKLRIVR